MDNAHRAAIPPVGGWNTFDSGPLAGRVVRLSLQELQKADHGRKYGRKDKRPLDPPPVVQVKFTQLIRQGSADQVEREFDTYDEFLTFGLLCHVDLFAEVTPNSVPTSPARQTYPFQPSIPTSLSRVQWPSSFSRSSLSSTEPAGPMAYEPLEPAIPFDVRTTSRPDYARAGDLSPERSHEPWNMRTKAYTAPPTASPFGHHLYPDENKCTDLLSGETVVSCSLVEYDGRKAAMFAFPDLAVKREGRFILRYRVFNLHSRPRGDGVVHVLAECFGGPFEVYSTKSFPGLQASTELTRRLSFSGVRVNSRQKERRGVKRDVRHSDADAPSPHGSTTPTALAARNASASASSSSSVRKSTMLPGGPYAQGFSSPESPFSHHYPAPSSAGGVPGPCRARSPGALAAWRIGGDAADMPNGGDSCSTGTEDGSTHSLW